MTEKRHTQIEEEIAHAAAQFFARESNRESLMTVTRAELSEDEKRVVVYFSVLPQSYEPQALNFAKRMRSDFRTYLKNHSRVSAHPFIDFELDIGEKNRQRIDELTNK